MHRPCVGNASSGLDAASTAKHPVGPRCIQAFAVRCCAVLCGADALKFVTVFRSQLPSQTLLSLLQPCTALLGSESVVVHSYAATAIERFLALKENGQTK